MSAALSPTTRSTRLLESEGYAVDIVERRIPRTLITKDLYGFGDLLAIHRETGDVKLVQVTTASNLAARIKKITDHENLALVRKAGWGIEAHGWRKDRSHAWTVRRVDLS